MTEEQKKCTHANDTAWTFQVMFVPDGEMRKTLMHVRACRHCGLLQWQSNRSGEWHGFKGV